MKKTILILSMIVSVFKLTAQTDSVLISQPGAGLNDGTDQGGISGGKDVYANDFSPVFIC